MHINFGPKEADMLTSSQHHSSVIGENRHSSMKATQENKLGHCSSATVDPKYQMKGDALRFTKLRCSKAVLLLELVTCFDR
jgi:hypothetical protein